MAIGATLLGASAVSSVLGYKSAEKQANAQIAATDRASQVQMDMFNKGVELLAPYREAGYGALGGLQQVIDQPASDFSFNYDEYFNSPEYAEQADQAQQIVLAGKSATGGLRSGGANVALSSIAPQLFSQAKQQAMGEFSLNQAAKQDQFNRLMGVAGLGLGSAQQNVSQAGQVGVQLGNNEIMGGNAIANKYAQQNAVIQGFLSDAGAVGMRRFGGGF